MMQWRVTVTDNQGNADDFIVAAEGATKAIEKAKEFWRRQAAKGATVVTVDARNIKHERTAKS